MRFKFPDRLQMEWWEIVPKLRLVLCDMDVFAGERLEELTLTCLLRTDEEQAAMYESGASPSKLSVHQFGRGADIRLVEDEAFMSELEEYVNRKYPYGKGDLKTMLVHVGTARHIHIQVKE